MVYIYIHIIRHMYIPIIAHHLDYNLQIQYDPIFPYISFHQAFRRKILEMPRPSEAFSLSTSPRTPMVVPRSTNAPAVATC